MDFEQVIKGVTMTQSAFIGLLTGACLASTAAQAAPIDFETIPGDVAAEGLQITDQFAATAGVTFSLLDGATGDTVSNGPVLADRGGDKTAFDGAGGGDQVISADQALIGGFFLTDDGLTKNGLRNPILVATYSVASSFIKADILDIDNGETFDIRFYDAAVGGTLLNTISITTSTPDTANGRATQVEYFHGSADILRVEFEGTGRFGSFFGLGFDNFDSGVTVSDIPLPASFGLLACALGGLAAGRRKRV